MFRRDHYPLGEIKGFHPSNLYCSKMAPIISVTTALLCSWPQFMWHIDGNHKLVRCRLVIQGRIDWFGRLVVYLHCSNNNKATTVLDQFIGAIQQYGLSLWVRSDHGVENVLVAQVMLQVKGGLATTGSSVNKQCIERLWHDLFSCVASLFYRLFYFLESADVLDPHGDTLWGIMQTTLSIIQFDSTFVLVVNSGVSYPLFRGCHSKIISYGV